ncbi:hypothetical protein AGABI1DRAFT_132304 [Agaricus bisporus var. burnettii JB137-S8]|uniref:Uncharacterized protein n=1 Tax=Agaricus bisporus var. burnettii (strain JB137-S8 / ATCC MYA-4627 / FGSC 10392) TaxID=597362 RepID=K5VLV6_AGABU|nr:uncharacterized protein AGABI1DRAFT_132304 [Agaricus bisporus var. burnettii JB137-S8]EKM75404.1 hypothetical protein AGABI1DRAFT_132304 [Agaricus bisporus var. burnettii JB137-S8]
MSSRSSDHTKLRTNAALTKEAEAEVRRAMGRTLKKLGAVEMEIAGLQDRLVVLGQRKRDTKSFIEAHRRLLSPIRQLLPEILQEIFWQCLPVAHNSVLSAKEAPLVLGRVCSQWRRIAYSTPKLWCSLHIAIPPLTYSRAQAIFEAYEAWIARSGILPLSISISDAKQLEVSKDQFRSYFELITLHTRRWRSIYFQVPFSDKLDFLAEIDGDRFPLLEGFHVDRGYFGNLAMVDHLLSRKDGILSAPLLRVLSISRISLGTLDLPVQWSLLTGLNLSYANLQECFELLTLCLNLEMCTLYDVGRSHHSFSNSQSSNKSRPNIVLSKLQTLEIVGELRQDDTSWILLDNLATPALRCFVYRTFEGQDLSPTDLLLSIKVFRLFFQRLNQPLEELQLNLEEVIIIISLYVLRFTLWRLHAPGIYSV